MILAGRLFNRKSKADAKADPPEVKADEPSADDSPSLGKVVKVPSTNLFAPELTPARRKLSSAETVPERQLAGPAHAATAEDVSEMHALVHEDFFGLRERPFLTVPDPEYLYWSDNHEMAYAVLRYGVLTRAPVTVITGEIGAGKTTLLRRLLNEVPEDVTVGLVSNMRRAEGPELMQWIMMALGEEIETGASFVKLFKVFQDIVIEEYANGRRVLLIFDEAQNLGPETLEDLRMLSNINADKDEILQLLLIGQPELRDMLARPELVQFAQRVIADFHLEALGPDRAIDYINHRLRTAGAVYEIFPPNVCRVIGQVTRGVPRLMNVLCDLCLVQGYAEDRRVITEDVLREVLTSVRKRGLYTQFDLSKLSPRLVDEAN